MTKPTKERIENAAKAIDAQLFNEKFYDWRDYLQEAESALKADDEYRAKQVVTGSDGELLPCRKCEGRGEISEYGGGALGAVPWFTVMCVGDYCGFTAEAGKTEAQAIKAWNTRAKQSVDDAELVAMLEEVLDICRDCEVNISNYDDRDVGILNNAHDVMFGTIEAALAVIKAQGVGWQDIESAPKDGTVLLLADGEMVLRGSFKEDYLTEEMGWFDEHWDDYSTGSTYTPLNPTHWQPLPQPPKGQSDE